ncbi:tRNA pseudouridine(55) synthase TruB, partial [Aliarcobacter skirrowii]
SGTKEWLEFGKKISIEYLEKKKSGKYIIELDDFFSIIEIVENEVKYILNKIPKLKENNG